MTNRHYEDSAVYRVHEIQEAVREASEEEPEYETTYVTMCCEVERELTYGGDVKCPDCGAWDVETIGRVTRVR